jgi:hypothetical protein
MATKLSKVAQGEREEARRRLLDIFAGQERPTVYTVLRHVSASGNSRDISLFTVRDGELSNITALAAKAMGENVKDRNGQWVIRVGGCGMDMGFHIVWNLSYSLYEGQERAGYVIRQEWA